MEIGTSLQAFITLPFILLMICIGFMTQGIKRCIEIFCRKIEISTIYIPESIEKVLVFLWKEVLLPGLPIVLGVLVGVLAHDFPVPDEVTGKSSRTIYFACCGFLSSFLYPRIKYLINKLPKNKE